MGAVHCKYGTTRHQLRQTRAGCLQILDLPVSLSRDDVLHQNQLQLSGRCRLRPSVVPMSAELGQDIGQEADGALPRDPKDKIEVLAEGKKRIEST
jgi:hypothetical protein